MLKDKPRLYSKNDLDDEPRKQNYIGYLESSDLTGEVKITIGEDSLLLSTVFNQTAVKYADITNIKLAEYSVSVITPSRMFKLNRLGADCDWFFRDLYNAYNRKVLKALFVQGSVILETSGEYVITGKNKQSTGTGVIQLYQNCLCILPPDKNARRIPLSFISDLKQDQYTLTLTLASNESISLSKLGYDTDTLLDKLTTQMLYLKENWLSFISALDSSMGMSKAVEAARTMPADQAVRLDTLSAKFPSLAKSIKAKIKTSRIADTFELLQEIGEGKQLLVGIKEKPSAMKDDEKEAGSLVNTEAEESQPPESEANKPEYAIWIIAPSKDQSTAILELALPGEEAAATYIFQTEGNFNETAQIIDRSLEAVDFRREYITLPQTKLKDDKYNEYLMLIERTPNLVILRQRFVGRAIHASLEKWKAEVLKHANGKTTEKGNQQITSFKKYCGTCGSHLRDNAKYCVECGAKV
ncbi:MAG: zinc ribbon domain-containing protein [Dehalococcoidales bacterium]|jgi:hypothetical protein|nr:zinc ribbon domain-containing protein [Dehalococcoidales bacterium]MDX9986304.1 zinc ribbon domain-containing protein [Dehalococcoidales bacterium]